jgi:hypothetical protein
LRQFYAKEESSYKEDSARILPAKTNERRVWVAKRGLKTANVCQNQPNLRLTTLRWLKYRIMYHLFCKKYPYSLVTF